MTLADVTAGNGAVHTIDEVLFPDFKIKTKNLVEVLKSQGFSAFAKALTETGIDKVIDHEGHFTVFAPTNEAFENPKRYPLHFSLRDRVAYHIARGLIKESTIQNDQIVPTLLAKRTLRFNIYFIEVSFQF